MKSEAPHPQDSGSPATGTEAPPPLRVLTFEVGPHLFAVPASDVRRILPAGEAPPGGTMVVDAVGLLRQEDRFEPTGEECLLLLASNAPGGAPLAVRASRAAEVRRLRPEGLLPFPGFIFRRGNPFLGLVPPEAGAEPRPVFVLAGPERLLACAGDP